MFVCDCAHCGRRELRGPRSLTHRPTGWWASCRHCGTDVCIVAAKPAAPESAQAA